MLELVELQFQYIGRFIEKQVVNFSQLLNFIQVDGQNNNTGGSSGAGKSTIFMAFDYLLGLPGTRPSTVMQSRSLINPEEHPIWVQGTFKLHGHIIILVRTKASLKLTMVGQTYEKAKAEEKLDALMGMSRDLFRKVVHKRQDEGGFFLNLTAGEVHNFLMSCIGLSPFKAKYETIEAELNNLEKQIEIEAATLAQNKTGLSATQDAILALGLAPVKEIHEDIISELKAKYDRSAAGFLERRSRCEALVQEYVRNRPNTYNGQYDGTVREDLERRRKEIEAQISSILEGERQRQEGHRKTVAQKNLERGPIVSRIDKGARAKADAAKIALEIKSIRANTCPTCSQEWKTESAVTSEKAKLDELTALKVLIDDGNQAVADLFYLDKFIDSIKPLIDPIYDPKLPDLNEEIHELTEKILHEKRKAQELYDQQSEEMKKKLDTFVAGQTELQKKLDIELDQARGQMDLDRRVHDAAVTKMQNFEAAKKTYDVSYNKLKRNEEVFQKQILSCENNLKIAKDCQIYALETKKCIKLYVSYSFDEALDAISEKATKIIRCIPNTSNATIQLEGTKETKEGKVKEEVNAVISVDGEVGVPLKSFSGGERSATDLAVDLAVIDYIETKTGKGLNLFILDEPFKGLGTVEIEMALEVLKNSNTNKKLTIVDHNPEVKQMVQNRLVVTRDGLTSRVV